MIAKNKKKKRHYRSLFFLIFLGFLVLLILGFLISVNLNIGGRRAELIERIESLKKEIQALEGENLELEAGIKRAGGEAFLEEKARMELGLKRPGEEVVVILSSEIEAKEEPEKKTFWEEIWRWLDF